MSRAPVTDWTTDFDVMDERYLLDPFPIWDDLRKTCPIAHTERRRGAWMLTTYDDVTAAAHDVATFSSLEVGVIGAEEDPDPEDIILEYGLLRSARTLRCTRGRAGCCCRGSATTVSSSTRS